MLDHWSDELHRRWSDQWHLLHVHSDGDERERHFGGVHSVGCGCSLNCPELSDGGIGDIERERSFGHLLDGTLQHGRCCDHRVHGDVIARWALMHLDPCDDLHRCWSDEWCELHLYGHRNERKWHVACLCSFGFGTCFHGSGCTYGSFGDIERERSVGRVLDGICELRRRGNHWVPGHGKPRWKDLFDNDCDHL